MRKSPIHLQRRKSKIGWARFLIGVKRKRNKKKFKQFRNRDAWRYHFMPNLSDNINWISSRQFAFSTILPASKDYYQSLRLKVPKRFSILERESESLIFLKKLFDILYYQKCAVLYIDYDECEEIELAASVCMDIILQDFIKYFKQCERRKLSNKLREIIPQNYNKNESIGKFLFSIGAFSTIKGFQLKYKGIIGYPLCTGCKSKPDSDEKMEVHTTQLVDYLKKCLERMERELTAEEERFFFQIIGEVMANAEEHSTTRHRYSIGYFQETENSEEHIGIFDLVILNFGSTIYEKFQELERSKFAIVDQMQELSRNYTQKGLFGTENFKEETLWTLYALQEGVTSTGQQRGSGTISFAEGFFSLKGDKSADDISRLSIISGRSRIIFDGTYGIVEEEKGHPKTKFKMLTFNNTGKIQDKPDNRFVKYVSNYFPGTLIAVKICIKHPNNKNQKNEHLYH